MDYTARQKLKYWQAWADGFEQQQKAEGEDRLNKANQWLQQESDRIINDWKMGNDGLMFGYELFGLEGFLAGYAQALKDLAEIRDLVDALLEQDEIPFPY
jgi:hypothetical protein